MKDLTLIDTAPCGYFSFTGNGQVLAMNRTLLAELELERAEIVGQPLMTLLTLPSRIFYQTHFYPLLRLQGQAREIYMTLQTGSGREVPVLVNAQLREEGDESCFDCFCITIHKRIQYEQELLGARKAAEEALARNSELQRIRQQLESNQQVLDQQISRLRQKNHDLEQFNKLISHDLREPVRKLILFADMLEKSGAEAQPALVEKIVQLCQRMKDLLASLQEYIALDTLAWHLTEVDLNQVLERARLLLATQSLTPIPISWSVGVLPRLEGDEQHLLLLFYHLMRYSLLSRPSDSTGSFPVQIQCTLIQKNSFQAVEDKYRYVDFAQITYSYTGKEINPYERDKLFSLQTRLHSKTIDTGYGLVLCKKIVEKHGGTITMQSSSSGKIKFTFLLPLKYPYPAGSEGISAGA